MPRLAHGVRAAALLCGIAAFAACAGAGAAPQPAPMTDAIPAELAGFVLSDSTQYQRNGGTSYRYRRDDGLIADLYVYPIPPLEQPCTGRCLDEAAEVETESFRRQIPALIEAGRWDSVGRFDVRPYDVSRASWLEGGRATRMRMMTQGTWYDSFLYLLAGRETYLKVRLSLPLGQGDASSAVESFVAEAVSRWPAPYRCEQLADEEAVSVSVTLADPYEEITRRVENAGERLAYRFAYANPAVGRWRTAPRFTPPVGAEGESWHNGRTTGVELFVVAEQLEDSTRFAVTAHELCAGPKAAAKVLEMLSALQFAQEVGEADAAQDRR